MTANPRIGTIDWVDLNTTDVEAARSFYTALLGWSYESSESPMGAYHVALANGHQCGGMMSGEPGTPAAWTVFIHVASLDETLAAIREAGGAVLAESFEIPGGAHVAVAADPAGAVFALISGGPQPGPDEPLLRRDEPGSVGWCELMSRDPQSACEFYEAVFGWMPTLDAPTGYTVWHRDDFEVGGMLPMPKEMPAGVPSSWMVYFTVADVDGAAATASAAGGSVLRPPAPAGPLLFAVVADPAGAAFGVMKRVA